MPLPATGPVTTSGPPPDYKALGSGQAKADFAAAANNRGWEFDAAAMDKVIQQLEDSINSDYTRAQNIGTLFAQVGPPGSDQVSQDYIDAAVRATTVYNQYLAGTVQYIKAYVEALKEVRTAYANHDQTAIDALRGTRKVD
ncbi:hypothetical protein [Amycolatopsis sp. FDAARGOS 1241]|uniref:hypothetical protein n=1 Tax=Amycolatopsis sp. FDAARGOS 1241 TaxID=2778070 RepID=UPI001EF38806|nr:hypothetical protein [Amycolatopsis sp. FDAARGOS 1241]